jgi:D-beta-D-heptose 7-phosphate kinase/D-beta-D-heptose 1-phosphate adenosyltransferase
VRRLAKGPGRPVNPEAERAEVLAALQAVDAVVIFDEDTPFEIVTALQPDVLVKGADWAADAIVGRDVVEARGGKVVRIPMADGYSTSAILERLQRR